ncbi:MAG TPA: dihydrofolate reductase family protein [Chitinophagaceae bacterium]
MRKIILLAHLSVDGFVASPDGGFGGFDPSDENLPFVCKLTESADAALFGRNSYELLEQYWPTAKDRPGAKPEEIAYSNWYNSAEKIVFSKTLTTQGKNNTRVFGNIIPEEIIGIKNEPGKDILIFGSPAVTRHLIQHDLVDSYWLFLYPALFGEGIPLFEHSNKSRQLKLVKTEQLSKGELMINYEPVK